MSKKNPEWLKAGEGFVDVTLRTTADVAGAKVSTMRMREPTVGDQEAAQAMDLPQSSREIHEFANLCEVSPDDIRKMTIGNYHRLQAAYLSFLA